MWEERLPVVASIDREELVGPHDPRLERFVSEVTAPEHPTETLECLVGVYRSLLPRLAVMYDRHRRSANPASDEPTIRTLTLCLRDLHEDWLEGESLVEQLIATPDDAKRAADRQARVEALLAERR
jgi:hypothetical protein